MAKVISKRKFSKERKKQLDLGVGEGIIDVVTALTLFGFPVKDSSEGSVEAKSFPWVYFYLEYTDKEKKNAFIHWRQKIEGASRRLDGYLKGFYQGRKNTPVTQELLIIHDTPPGGAPYSGFKLSSRSWLGLQAKLPQDIVSDEVHQSFLSRYQAEMLAFAEFLKQMP